MAKGIKAAPKKRKKKRLSEHARLVEERARSIPPRVVHELFDTSTLPVPPPAPTRHATPGRFVSKPPPAPPRPNAAPENVEEAELEDLEGVEELEEVEEVEALEEVDGAEESQSDGYGSHTIPPRRSEVAAAAPGSSQRSRVLPVAAFAIVVGALALVTGRELGRSRTVEPRGEPKAASVPVAERKQEPSLAPLPPPPVADDLPLLPPGVVATASAESPREEAEASRSAGEGETSETSVARVSPDPTTAAPALAEPPGSPRGVASAASPSTAPPPRGDLPVFDAAVADAAIQAAFQRAQGCRGAADPKGVATVTLTYAPSGRVTTALVSGVFAGTSAGSCIAAALRSARIGPFTGALVTVKRSATLE